MKTTVNLDYTQPDLVLFDREKKEYIVVEKIAKHVPLARDLTKLRKM